MNRKTLQTAIAVALFATLAVAGCKKKADQAVTTTPPASEPAPMGPAMSTPAASMTVTTVDLGNALGADNRVAAPMSNFAPTDTIHASIGTDGPTAGTLTAKWSYEDGQVVDSTDKSVPAGPQVTEFSIAKPDGWPTGKYKLEVMLDGNMVQSRDFDIR